ncbi:MAG: VOC family protein [Thermomicrobiales bacterium]
MLHTPQVNVYVEDVEPSVTLFRDLFGFEETFRTPAEGRPDHVEMRFESLVLGFVDMEAARRMHRLELKSGPPSAEVVLWTDDIDREYDRLLRGGATSVSAPHVFLGRLRAAWLAGSNDERIQIVQRWAPETSDQPL